MFKSFFEQLLNQSSDPDVKEVISSILEGNIGNHAPDLDHGQMADRAIHGAFTWIANASADAGDNATSQMAREMRDETDRYVSGKYQR